MCTQCLSVEGGSLTLVGGTQQRGGASASGIYHRQSRRTVYGDGWEMKDAKVDRFSGAWIPLHSLCSSQC